MNIGHEIAVHAFYAIEGFVIIALIKLFYSLGKIVLLNNERRLAIHAHTKHKNSGRGHVRPLFECDDDLCAIYLGSGNL